MKTFKFKKIDAFATVNSEGNPAGYIWPGPKSDISESEMLQIAKELKGYVNEVGYIFQTSENEFDLKYYSSEREVDFCGHATIAIMYDLIKNNLHLQKFDKLIINTNRGTLDVENRIETEDSVYIMSPEPFKQDALPLLKDIAKNLRIKETDISLDFPISIINAGLSTLIVPIKDMDSILKITPGLNELKEFCISSQIDIIEVFTADVFNKANNYRVRVFAPTFGYIEDPATGSGNSSFGYYLINNGLWDNGTIQIEQNGFRDKYNIVKLQKQTDNKHNERVLFGGAAITRLEGTYNLYK